jgi:hypothetical protein
MWGHELTKGWAEETGCKEPVVIPRGHGEGMGMVMPTDLTVRKVADLVGPDTKVEVIGTTLFFKTETRRPHAKRGTKLEIKTVGRLL